MRTVAVVEDNPDNRLLVHAILEDQYQVVSFTDGPEALEGMGDAEPDLILLDISLPAMDGEEVLREIRGDGRLRGIPVVAFTAHNMAGDRERLLAAGFDDYLAKPVTVEMLVGVVRRWIGG